MLIVIPISHYVTSTEGRSLKWLLAKAMMEFEMT